jgi:hypothetical protein
MVQITALSTLAIGAALLGLYAAPVSAEGINCKGSALCNSNSDSSSKVLVDLIRGIDDNRWYNNGQHVACYNKICAFLQGTGGAWGYNIKGLAHFIKDHGCDVCGSVPYYYPGINDVSKGMLTFNWVEFPKCSGAC